jgi:hypothetical protein
VDHTAVTHRDGLAGPSQALQPERPLDILLRHPMLAHARGIERQSIDRHQPLVVDQAIEQSGLEAILQAQLDHGLPVTRPAGTAAL